MRHGGRARRARQLEMAVCAIGWGTTGPIVRSIGLPAAEIVFFRLALGFLFLTTWMLVRGRLKELHIRTLDWLLLGSGASIAAGYTLIFTAYKRVGVDMSVFVLFLGPVLWVLAAPFVLKEQVNPTSLVALAVAFSGTALIAVPGFSHADTAGLLAALGASAMFAVLILSQKLLVVRYPPLTIVAWQLGIAAILMSPSLLHVSGDIMGQVPLLLLIGVLLTGILNVLLVHAVSGLDSQQVGVLYYLEPASAVLWAWWWLGECPSVLMIIGGALIIGAGVALVRFD